MQKQPRVANMHFIWKCKAYTQQNKGSVLAD
jgi:hypothetical protein